MPHKSTISEIAHNEANVFDFVNGIWIEFFINNDTKHFVTSFWRKNSVFI